MSESVNDALSDKDKILSGYSNTGTRLRNQGIDMSGVYFGINDKLRTGEDKSKRQSKFEVKINNLRKTFVIFIKNKRLSISESRLFTMCYLLNLDARYDCVRCS